MLKEVSIGDLIPFDLYTKTHPIKIDVVYAQKDHKDNIFKTALYKKDARILGCKELVALTLNAAEICHDKTGLFFEIKDCLRPIEVQQTMRDTEIVKQNPSWLEEPNQMLSKPGQGGHPRAMAVDIILIDKNGDEIDMGTSFDYFTKDKSCNPASRNYSDFSKDILNNRLILENAMLQAAENLNAKILPLAQEWWDFRFLPEYTHQFNPISDKDLPAELRMTA